MGQQTAGSKLHRLPSAAAAQIQTTQQFAKEKPRQETTSNLLKTLFTAFTKELIVVKVEHHIELSWGV